MHPCRSAPKAQACCCSRCPSLPAPAPRPDRLVVTYRSTRPFAALAEGLIRGCVAHYGEPIEVETEDLSDGAGTAARFVLTKREAAA